MPEIKGMTIEQNELDTAVIRVKELIRLSKEKHVSNEEMRMMKNHVEQMLTRMKAGQQKLDENGPIVAQNPSALNKERFHKLESLYLFLLELVGLYDEFFKKRLSESDYHKVVDYFLTKWEG